MVLAAVCLVLQCSNRAVAQLSPDFAAAGVDIFVLYPGSVASVQAFKDSVAQLQEQENMELPFRIALDVNQLLIKQLDIRGDLSKPASLILDDRRRRSLGLCWCRNVRPAKRQNFTQQAKLKQ